MIKQIQKGKVAVISGSTGYVGSAVTRKLAEVNGFTVALIHEESAKKKAEDLIKMLPGSGHKAYQCDIENAQEVERVMGEIEKDLGDIFACVPTAGTKPKRKQLMLSSVEEMKDQFKTNVFGSFNFLSACGLRMKEHKGGVMIGITSAGIIVPSASKSLGAYIPAKYALQGILSMFKEELAEFGVRVYSIAPGFMSGGMNSDIPKAFVQMIKEKSQTKTLISAEDVADKISFLCSPEAENIRDLTFILAPEISRA